MADTAIDLLIGTIASAVGSEVKLLQGVSDELEDIEKELVSMRCFLEDAKRKRGLNEGEKAWVSSVRAIVEYVDDFIDENTYRKNRQRHMRVLERFLNRIICLPTALWEQHQVATKLKKISKDIKAISERRQRYGVDRIQGTSSSIFGDDDDKWIQRHSESSLFKKEDDLVGFQDNKNLLLTRLTDAALQQRIVISVLGMAGLGKTTLAAKVYESLVIKRHFSCSAWISVSQNYAVEDLLRKMINEFNKLVKNKEFNNLVKDVPKDLSTVEFKDLVEELINFLKSRRYIVVLDDVWSRNLWKDISDFFPDTGCGSRVIITTRDETVAAAASSGVGSFIHPLQVLGHEDAWDLFRLKAFPNNLGRSCPEELESIARNLVAKCGGLPLAIVALGGAMSSKQFRTQLHWTRVGDFLDFQLKNNPELEKMKSIVLLSFNSLPIQLKRCFLYCSLFPEAYEIESDRIIRLWIAERFVEKVKGLTLEQEGERYLMELVSPSMLQIVHRTSSGRPSGCKMHDLMRELALSIARTEKFGNIYEGKEPPNEENCGSALRLSISVDQSSKKELCTPYWEGMPRIRSLLMFQSEGVSTSPSLKKLPPEMLLLNVLDLKGLPIVKLPDRLVDLFNLRYLNLRGTKVKELPKSIARLRDLETLDAEDTEIKQLPTGMTKLQNLRHLCAYRKNTSADFEYISGTPALSNICQLKQLQSLAFVEAESELLKELGQMAQLTMIGITRVKEEHGDDLCKAIQNLNLLEFIHLTSANAEEYLRIEALSAAPPRLRKLFLCGRLRNLPHWFQSLNRLTYLLLFRSGLTEDPLPFIQTLPSLVDLHLCSAYVGSKLHFRSGFSKLEVLRLTEFPQLSVLIIGRGVMPGLKVLRLRRCRELKKLPDEIINLTNLEELKLIKVSPELKNDAAALALKCKIVDDSTQKC